MWIQRHWPRGIPGDPAGRTWFVLDAHGEGLFQLRIPIGVRPLVVTREGLWGVETGTLGVESLVHYRVVPG